MVINARAGPTMNEKGLKEVVKTLEGSNAVSSRYPSKGSTDKMKFSKMVYTKGPVKMMNKLLKCKLNTNPMVAIRAPKRPFHTLIKKP